MLFPTLFLSSTRHNSWCQRNTSFRFALQEMLTCQQMPPQASFCPSFKHFRNQIDWSWYQIMTPSPSYFFHFFDETFLLFNLSLLKVISVIFSCMKSDEKDEGWGCTVWTKNPFWCFKLIMGNVIGFGVRKH